MLICGARGRPTCRQNRARGFQLRIFFGAFKEAKSLSMGQKWPRRRWGRVIDSMVSNFSVSEDVGKEGHRSTTFANVFCQDVTRGPGLQSAERYSHQELFVSACDPVLNAIRVRAHMNVLTGYELNCERSHSGSGMLTNVNNRNLSASSPNSCSCLP